MNTKSTEKSYKETFFIVPSYILDLPGLTLGFLKVYETIFQFWNKGLDCFLGVERICERTNLAKTQVYDAIAFFVKNHEIQRIKIDGKKYITKPLRKVETDCTDNIQESFEVGEEFRSSGKIIPAQRKNNSARAEHNIKKGNKEINIDLKKEGFSCDSEFQYQETLYPMPSNKQESSSHNSIQLSLLTLTEANNPHKIPMQMLIDWFANRKAKRAPLTITAWNRLNNQLAKCPNAIEAFEEMIARGWISVNPEWLESVKKKKSVDLDHNDISWGKDFAKDFTDVK